MPIRFWHRIRLAPRQGGLALGDRGPILYLASGVDIGDTQANQIAASQLAVDRHIEKREVEVTLCKFKAHPNRPDMFWKQGTLLTYEAALVTGRAVRPDGGKVYRSHNGSSDPPLTTTTPAPCRFEIIARCTAARQLGALFASSTGRSERPLPRSALNVPQLGFALGF